jgi:hypothetical protein
VAEVVAGGDESRNQGDRDGGDNEQAAAFHHNRVSITWSARRPSGVPCAADDEVHAIRADEAPLFERGRD